MQDRGDHQSVNEGADHGCGYRQCQRPEHLAFNLTEGENRQKDNNDNGGRKKDRGGNLLGRP